MFPGALVAVIDWSDPTIVGSVFAALIAAAASLLVAFVKRRQTSSTAQGDRASTASDEQNKPTKPSAEPERRRTWLDTDQGEFWSCGEESNTLVIFVHGILGDSRTTWEPLRSFLAEAVPSADYLSYRYPAGIACEASIWATASRLRASLTTQFPTYENLVFITHSAGGLVVKRMLVDDADDYDEPGANDQAFRDLKPLLLRTRQMINIAVPHSGGSRIASLALVTGYYLASPGLLGVAWVKAGFLALIGRYPSRKGFRVGLNRMAWQLRHESDELVRLEQRFRSLTRDWYERSFSRVGVVDVHGSEDDTIAYTDTSEQSGTGPRSDHHTMQRRKTDRRAMRYVFFGTHRLVRSASSSEDGIVRFLRRKLQAVTGDERSLLATKTLVRTFEIDGSKEALRHLGAEAQEVPLPTPKFRPVAIGSQAESIERLLADVTGASTERLLVLTGGAGLGKSYCLRTMARNLAGDILSGRSESARLPLFVPLQQFRARTDQLDLLALLESNWVEWINSLVGRSAFTAEWLQEQLRTGDSLLILDSVDEFLAANWAVSSDRFREALDRIHSATPAAERLRILVGVRRTHPSVEMLKAHAGSTYEVRSLTEEEAVEYFPRTAALIRATARSSESSEVLRTPLILARLKHLDEQEQLEGIPDSIAALFSLAVRATLARSELSKVTLRDGSTRGIDTWEFALSLVGRVFAVGAGGTPGMLSTDEIRSLSEAIISRARNEDGGTSRRYSEAAPLISEEGALLSLLRTFFLATGPSSFRIEHREWQDYLLGSYFARCVEASEIVELNDYVLSQRAFQFASEALHDAGFQISKELTSKIVTNSVKGGSDYLVANFAGLIGNAPIAIDRDALDLLVSNEPNLPRSGALVVATSLGRRGMGVFRTNTDQPAAGDLYADQIRKQAELMFVTILRRVGNQLKAGLQPAGGDRVLASFAWCNLTVWKSTTVENIPWPTLDLTEEQEREVVAAGLARRDGLRFSANGPYHTAQRAFLNIQEQVPKHPTWAITCVHYLYMLSVAVKLGVVLPDIANDLRTTIREDGPITTAYRDHNLVRDRVVQKAFEHCRAQLAAASG